MSSFSGSNILITGASAGFGAEFARQLAPQAGVLILAARRLDRLQALQAELQSAHPTLQIKIRQVDLTLETDRRSFLQQLEQDLPPVDFLINNAGLGDIGPFHSSDWSRIEPMLAVNILALTELTHRLVPLMKKGGRGKILNVSSLASIFPIPDFAVYAASKAYVSSFTEALRIELAPFGIQVTALCPGPVPTEFGQVARRKEDPGSVPGTLTISVERAVAEALRALAQNKARVFPGTRVKMFAAFISLLPLVLLRRLLALRRDSGNRDR